VDWTSEGELKNLKIARKGGSYIFPSHHNQQFKVPNSNVDEGIFNYGTLNSLVDSTRRVNTLALQLR
jgi:hypothetical protein